MQNVECSIENTLRNVENDLEMRDIEYPVTLKAIDQFEKQNINISINVLTYGLNIYPLRISKSMDRTIVNHLLISDENGNQHYCLIKNMSRLLSSQTSNRNGETYFCFGCLNPFHS